MYQTKIVNEAVSVEARLLNEQLQPSQVTWRERVYPVISVGRQWLSAEGRYVLVELQGGDRMELCYHHAQGWRLNRHWAARGVA